MDTIWVCNLLAADCELCILLTICLTTRHSSVMVMLQVGHGHATSFWYAAVSVWQQGYIHGLTWRILRQIKTFTSIVCHFCLCWWCMQCLATGKRRWGLDSCTWRTTTVELKFTKRTIPTWQKSKFKCQAASWCFWNKSVMKHWESP